MILSTIRNFSLAAVMWLPVLQGADGCGFTRAFDRPDDGGRKMVPVYEGRAEQASGGAAPLAFVSPLKVNTDGTRISYKVDDPRAANGAINDIRNAMHKGFTIGDFEKVAASDWEPLNRTWRVLSAAVIEKDTKTGKPCVAQGGYLVSKTADVAVKNGRKRDGDCDQSKWIDALTIPALVLPLSSQFQAKKALTRNFVVVMTLEHKRAAYGIVGDAGPADQLGEASVEMNRILNGLPAGTIPKNAKDAINRFQAPKSLVLIFPGAPNRLDYPVTPERVMAQAKARVADWGGEARLAACLAEIPEARP
jgi:hypothetical protein